MILIWRINGQENHEGFGDRIRDIGKIFPKSFPKKISKGFSKGRSESKVSCCLTYFVDNAWCN